MLQQDRGDDYVLATGEAHAVREFVEIAFSQISRRIVWSGHGVEEVGRDDHSGEILVRVDARYFRPTEVDFLLGDPSKARSKLGWQHQTTFPALVAEMVAADLVQIEREHGRKEHRT